MKGEVIMSSVITNALAVLSTITVILTTVFAFNIVRYKVAWQSYGDWKDRQHLSDWISGAVFTSFILVTVFYGVFRYMNNVIYLVYHIPSFEVWFVNTVIFDPIIGLSLVLLSVNVGILIGFASFPKYYR